VHPESQPLTPVSSCTPDHADARTPQSIRSLESEPLIHPVVTKQSGRKRKLDRNASKIENLPALSNQSGSVLSTPHVNHTVAHTHSSSPLRTATASPCTKRQSLGQSEGTTTMESATNLSLQSQAISRTSNGSSPHAGGIDSDSGVTDNPRWRKSVHQPPSWENAVSLVSKFCLLDKSR